MCGRQQPNKGRTKLLHSKIAHSMQDETMIMDLGLQVEGKKLRFKRWIKC